LEELESLIINNIRRKKNNMNLKQVETIILEGFKSIRLKLQDLRRKEIVTRVDLVPLLLSRNWGKLFQHHRLK
jgi:hypothetical protein